MRVRGVGGAGRRTAARPLGISGGLASGSRGGYLSEGTLDFLAADAQIGPIVKGAPYSGEGVTTLTQTLSDGTRIERTVRARFYRDGEGRTRREQTILGLGPLGESQTVTIVDPVAGVMYGLNPARHEGRRSQLPAPGTRRFGGHAGRRVGPPPPPPPPPGAGDIGAPAATPTAAWRWTRLAPEALRRAGAEVFLRAYRTRRSRWARSRSMA